MANVYRGDIFYVENRVNQNPVGSEMWSGRPAVIVSDDAHNMSEDTVTVVYLTTKEKRQSAAHVPVKTTCNATALCEQIACIDVSRLGQFVCHVTDAEMDAIERALVLHLGLPYVPSAKRGENDEPKVAPKVVAAAEKINEQRAVEVERDLYKRMYEQLLERMLGK